MPTPLAALMVTALVPLRTTLPVAGVPVPVKVRLLMSKAPELVLGVKTLVPVTLVFAVKKTSVFAAGAPLIVPPVGLET